MSISRFNSPNFVSKLEPVKQVLLSGPSSLMYSNKPRALLESHSPSRIVGPTSVQPNSDKRTILKMIHDLPEENTPINETLRLLQEEFPLKTLSKKYQERFFFCKTENIIICKSIITSFYSLNKNFILKSIIWFSEKFLNTTEKTNLWSLNTFR